MKKALFFLIIIYFTNIFITNSQSIKAITYNLRYENTFDGDNAWSNRKERVSAMLSFYDADIFGIQEGLSSQIVYLDSCLPQYYHAGIGRDDGKTKGEHSAIFYKTNKFELLKTSTFWLSETPDTVSMGWDAVCNRICTYVLLKDKKTQQKIWVFNTHFDHIGEKAQQNSARLIIDRIKKLNKENYPIVLMGDFNMTPDKEPIKYITTVLKDAKYLYKKDADSTEGTFNAFEFNKPVTSRIDYFFVSGFKVTKYRVLTDSYHCKYLSDHLPVFVEISKQ
ncbi:MAG: endonuclease/exonuclease/phosphatase family protein [Bacteroidales bacterium]